MKIPAKMVKTDQGPVVLVALPWDEACLVHDILYRKRWTERSPDVRSALGDAGVPNTGVEKRNTLSITARDDHTWRPPAFSGYLDEV